MRLQRQSLVTQAVAALQHEIAAGTWTDWLPTERDLCVQFQISRSTIRLALDELKSAGLIVAQPGAGTRLTRDAITPGAAPRSERPRSVGVILAEPLAKMRPYFARWMDHLKSLLHDAGVSIHFYFGRQYFHRNNTSALAKLVDRHPHGCWFSGAHGPDIGDWFRARGLAWIETRRRPGRLAVYPDGRSLAVHAAGRMLSQRHTHIAVLVQSANEEGTPPAAAGFMEGVAQARRVRSDIQADVIDLPENIEAAARRIRQILRFPGRPTAILIGNPLLYLTVFSVLVELGLAVPQDVSLVSTFGDPFLPYMLPEPTRYENHAGVLAKKLSELCLALIDGRVVEPRNHPIMPDFIKGATLAAPPAAPRVVR